MLAVRYDAGITAATLFNLAVAYGLLVVVGSFELRHVAHAAISAAGFGLASVGIAGSVVRLQGGSS
jgi:hypothetical protein